MNSHEDTDHHLADILVMNRKYEEAMNCKHKWFQYIDCLYKPDNVYRCLQCNAAAYDSQREAIGL